MIRTIIYGLMTLFFIFLLFASLYIDTLWIYKIGLLIGLINAGKKFLDCLEERGK